MTFKKSFEIRTDIPEHRRPEGSINAALHELPVRQKYLGTGTLVYLPRTGFIVTLIEHGTGGMRGVIVVGNETYPRGGYDIDVSDWEVQRAVVLPDDALRDIAIATYQKKSTTDEHPQDKEDV